MVDAGVLPERRVFMKRVLTVVLALTLLSVPFFPSSSAEEQVLPLNVASSKGSVVFPGAGVDLTWSRINSAVKYRVSVRNAKTGEALISGQMVFGTSFRIDPSITYPGRQLEIRVSALNAQGYPFVSETILVITRVIFPGYPAEYEIRHSAGLPDIQSGLNVGAGPIGPADAIEEFRNLCDRLLTQA